VTKSASRFRFVQLDVPGSPGLDDGRYLLRGDDAQGNTVVVVQTLAAPVQAGRSRRRRRHPRRAEPGALPEVPLTRFTVISAPPSERDAAAASIGGANEDADLAEAAVTAALGVVNELLRAHAVATHDPHGPRIAREAALIARLGYGTGEGLAEGRWEDAIEVPHPERRRRRAEALRPQERIAAVLAGREQIDVCEVLLLRARADLDQDHPREAAIQLRAGLEALLAELPGRAGPEQEEDLNALKDRLAAADEAARDALGGELSPSRLEEVGETLAICERVLRRRQILRGD